MVTNAQLVVQGKTYAMANITSVLLGIIPANRGPGIILAILGLVGFVGCVSSPETRENGLFVVGLLMVIAGVAWALWEKPKYVVRIGSASGETDALVSPDGGYIRGIVQAINQAIVARG